MSHFLKVPITSCPDCGNMNDSSLSQLNGGSNGNSNNNNNSKFISGGEFQTSFTASTSLKGGAAFIDPKVIEVYKDFMRDKCIPSTKYDVTKEEDQKKLDELIACDDKKQRYFGLAPIRKSIGPNHYPVKLKRSCAPHYCLGGGAKSDWYGFKKPNSKSNSPMYYGVEAREYKQGEMVAGKKGYWRAIPQWNKWVQAHKYSSTIRHSCYNDVPNYLKACCCDSIECCDSAKSSCQSQSKHAKALADAKKGSTPAPPTPAPTPAPMPAPTPAPTTPTKPSLNLYVAQKNKDSSKRSHLATAINFVFKMYPMQKPLTAEQQTTIWKHAFNIINTFQRFSKMDEEHKQKFIREEQLDYPSGLGSILNPTGRAITSISKMPKEESKFSYTNYAKELRKIRFL